MNDYTLQTLNIAFAGQKVRRQLWEEFIKLKSIQIEGKSIEKKMKRPWLSLHFTYAFNIQLHNFFLERKGE